MFSTPIATSSIATEKLGLNGLDREDWKKAPTYLGMRWLDKT